MVTLLYIQLVDRTSLNRKTFKNEKKQYAYHAAGVPRAEPSRNFWVYLPTVVGPLQLIIWGNCIMKRFFATTANERSGVTWENCTREVDLPNFHFFVHKMFPLVQLNRKSWFILHKRIAQFASQTSLLATTPFTMSCRHLNLLWTHKNLIFYCLHQIRTIKLRNF